MKREIANIIKYLIVYGVLLVLPVAIIAICEVVRDRVQGGTMTSDEVWQTPFMTTGMMLGSMLIIAGQLANLTRLVGQHNVLR